MFLAVRSSIRERRRYGAISSEVANQASWILVTVAWLV
jgi:hypothetical protein